MRFLRRHLFHDAPPNLWLAWLLPAATVLAATAGCGDGASHQQESLATSSVQAALDAWKEGASAESLITRSPAIEFHDDDWKRAARLVDYQILQTYRDTDGGVRCAVQLTVQSDRGEPAPIEVTYQVNTEPKIVIARDPMS